MQGLSNGFPQRRSFPENDAAPNLARVSGIGPSRLLFETSKDFISCLRFGIFPENWFPSRWSSLRRSSSVKEIGISPENLFPASQIFFREDNCLKKSCGIVPEKEFWVKRRDLIVPSLLKLGISPEKELLTKLRVRRPRISARASTSIAPERLRSERWRPVMMLLKQITPTHVPEHGDTFGIHEDSDESEFVRDCFSLRRDCVSDWVEKERERKSERRNT